MAKEGIEYHIRAIMEAKKASGTEAKLAQFAAGLRGHADQVAAAGSRLMSSAGGLVTRIGSMAAPLAGMVSLGAIGAGITTAVKGNADLENSMFGMASSLQLMNRNAGDFSANMSEGQYIMDELFKRAATSPASFEQAQELFRNMLPGAIMVTKEMDRILNMGEAALTLGIQMGGDFRQAGSDLRRILTGQAGADVRAWVEGLKTPIEELGHAKFGMKKFGKDFVAEFNTMDPQKRFELVEEAVSRLGPATASAATMWAGLTSTVAADLGYLHRLVGKDAFDVIKDRLKGIVGQGGVLDPKGTTMKKLEGAASFMGHKIGQATGWVIDRLVEGITWGADHWQEVIAKMSEMWDRAKSVAKMFLAAKMAQGVVGAGMAAGGGAAGIVGKGLSIGGQVADAVRALGVSGLFALPILLVAGAALAGVGVAVGGMAAYVVENWDAIIASFKDGTISLAPLLDLVDLLWVKMVAVGQAFLGTTSAVDVGQGAVSALETAMYGLMGAMSLALRTMGWVQIGFNVIEAGVKSVYMGLLMMVMGVLGVVQSALSILPDAASSKLGLGKVDDALDSMASHAHAVESSIRGDAETANNNKFLAAADAFDAAYVQGEGVTAGIRDELATWSKGSGEAGVAGSGGSSAGTAGVKRPAGNVNINKLIINQDLRGADPDRVIGAFYRDLDKSTRQRTQPLTGVQGGS